MENGILVVTESLFSMDSDTPDLRALQELCHEYEATLMVDVAHDLGAMGEDGRGFIGQQGMSGQIDIVMGSFSKTFASNGGFVACNSPAVRQYLKFYGCSATFSNALSPVQAATVTKAFDIVQSDKGRQLRRLLLKRVGQMRDALAAAGLQSSAIRRPIVPVLVGDEALARMVSRRLPELEVIANLVEYPAVAKGNARFRLQMMPTHSAENVAGTGREAAPSGRSDAWRVRAIPSEDRGGRGVRPRRCGLIGSRAIYGGPVMVRDILIGIIDWFIPAELRKSNANLWRARIFVISHMLGPFSAIAILGYLYRALQAHDVVFWTICVLCGAFWLLPLGSEGDPQL